jgi:uncharacterized membrane protein YkoI
MKLAMRVALLTALAIGCDQQIENPDPIALDKIPAEVMAIAKKELPGVEFEKAWTGKADAEMAYEIRGHAKDGKVREVKISASGKVLEKE